MGNKGSMNLNSKAIKESWEFHSEMHCGNLNLGQLKGNVIITEDDEIQINGILRLFVLKDVNLINKKKIIV